VIVLLGILVFVAAATYDFVYGMYVGAVSRSDASKAARLSVATYGVGLLSLVGILKVSLWLIIPEALGLYVGTYMVVEYQAFSRDRDDE
jgi:hypothetical protein